MGCSYPSQKKNESVVTSLSTEKEECPEQQKYSLAGKNVKTLNLSEQTTKESGIAHKSKPIAYTFEAQKEQKIDYQVNKDVCILIYTPENNILKSVVLPQTGKYIIQVSAVKASTTFDLEMSLHNAQSSSPVASNSSSSQSVRSNTVSSNPSIPQSEQVLPESK